MKHLFLLFLLIVFSNKVLSFDFKATDSIYRNDIKSVQFCSYTTSNSENAKKLKNLFPIISQTYFDNDYRNNNGLALKFDIINKDYENFVVRFFHYNHDWAPSQLSGLDFLEEDEFNEYEIYDMYKSSNTDIDYIHYKIKLPNFGLSGNYILAVFPEKSDIPVITKKFFVISPCSKINTSFNELNNKKGEKQTFKILLNYKDLNIESPSQNLKVIIAQNKNYDQSIIINSTSNLITDNFEQMLQFEIVNPKKQFHGGNEFRHFDIRKNSPTNLEISEQYYGKSEFKSIETKSTPFPELNTNINSRDYDTHPLTVFLAPDTPRNKMSYQAIDDINGTFTVSNSEGENIDTTGNYVYTYFVLKNAPLYRHGLFLYGELTNWKFNKDFQFSYDQGDNIYYLKVLLKQGYYNYTYLLKDKKEIMSHQVDGSFSQTENIYEVFVYNCSPDQSADSLIGYQRHSTNAKP